MKQNILTAVLLLQAAFLARAQSSQHVGVASRVLRPAPSNGSRENCKRLEDNAEKILNEFYQPAFFYCDCVATWGGLRTSAEYDLSCKTHRALRRNGIYGFIHWSAKFKKMMPVEEKSCVKYSSKSCGLVDDKDICYSFDYSRPKEAKKSSPALSCAVSVDGTMCSGCSVCDGKDTQQGMHYTAANCTNIAGMEDMNYQCKGLKKDIKDVRDVVFKCPENGKKRKEREEKEMKEKKEKDKRDEKSNLPSKEPRKSEEEKEEDTDKTSSRSYHRRSKSSKRGKSGKGSKSR